MMTVKRCYFSSLRGLLFSIQLTSTVLALLVLLAIIKSFFIMNHNIYTESQSQDLKYILIWHSYDYQPFRSFGHGRQQFLDAKCPVNQCYITQNRDLLKDITQFDAIAFNGRTIHSLHKSDLPQQRSPKQKYVYFNMESSSNTPVTGSQWDNFFNWTATYRLDSDIPCLYMTVKNKKGEIIGPTPNMKWVKKMKDVPEDIVRRLRNKTKPVAWYVSNCVTVCKREIHYARLKSALSSYGIEVDVYGACGKYSCSRNNEEECDKKLEENYLFYLAYENSCNQDYVTEKVLRAFECYAVPIVYGGADYTRFLPPNSYIDTSKVTPMEIAGIIASSLRSLPLYRQFFRWRSHYNYFAVGSEPICALCAALHNKTMMETKKVYASMERWWS